MLPSLFSYARSLSSLTDIVLHLVTFTFVFARLFVSVILCTFTTIKSVLHHTALYLWFALVSFRSCPCCYRGHVYDVTRSTTRSLVLLQWTYSPGNTTEKVSTFIASSSVSLHFTFGAIHSVVKLSFLSFVSFPTG